MSERERPQYTVTECRDCGFPAAIVLEEGRYACTACTETGSVRAGGYGNVPDARPDPALAVILGGVLEASPTIREFQTLCKVKRLARPREVGRERRRR